MWTMKRRPRLARVTAVLITAAVAALAASGLASPLASGSDEVRLDRPALGNVFFSQRFARAELVVVVGGVPRSIRVDRGRVRAVAAGSLTLLERDGTLVTIPVSPTATIRVNGRPAALAEIRRGALVLTARDGDAPANAVEAVGRGRGR